MRKLDMCEPVLAIIGETNEIAEQAADLKKLNMKKWSVQLI